MKYLRTTLALAGSLLGGSVHASDLNFSGRDMLSPGLKSQIDIQLANMNERPNICTPSDLECAIANSAKNSGMAVKDLGIKLNYQNGGFKGHLKLRPQNGIKVDFGMEYKF